MILSCTYHFTSQSVNCCVSFPVLRGVLTFFSASVDYTRSTNCEPSRRPRLARYPPELSGFVTGNRVAQFRKGYNVTILGAQPGFILNFVGFGLR
jgi:hypothetical protein